MVSRNFTEACVLPWCDSASVKMDVQWQGLLGSDHPTFWQYQSRLLTCELLLCVCVKSLTSNGCHSWAAICRTSFCVRLLLVVRNPSVLGAFNRFWVGVHSFAYILAEFICPYRVGSLNTDLSWWKQQYLVITKAARMLFLVSCGDDRKTSPSDS